MSRPFGSTNRKKAPPLPKLTKEELQAFAVGDLVRVRGGRAEARIEAFDSEYPDIAILDKKLPTVIGDYWFHNLRTLERIKK